MEIARNKKRTETTLTLRLAGARATLLIWSCLPPVPYVESKALLGTALR